ncbi:MAG: C-terminal helicase domain-containing protein, partial [Candidatus Zapsychrus exili]|nr:C-terminal helicase domain-containing protein [Candidatus Zapsychrus exili]
QSCINLLLKLLAFVELHDRKKSEHWRSQIKHTEILKWIKQVKSPETEDEEDADEDVIQEELKLKVEKLIVDPQNYHMDTIIELTLKDLNLLVTFLIDLKVFKPEQDDKIQALINLMRNDQDLQKQKVLIFTEFKDTANYIERELKNAGIDNVDEIDSSDGRNHGDIIENFSPYYNGYSSQYLKENKRKEIRVLVATDILAEGLNLQDASLMINYDLHWNPVRLMQRIGRVDRRFDAAVEENLVKSHPEVAELRGKVRFWNFLPPDELNDVLTLYKRVTDKTLRISKTLGIEGRQLLTPEDDYESLREFNNIYEGAITVEEEMRLEYQRFLRDYPEIAQKLNNYPLRLFSGKEKQEIESKHVFFCYELPSKNANGEWLIESGYVRWYLYNTEANEVTENIKRIVDIVHTPQGTPRKVSDDKLQLVEIKGNFEKKVLDPFLREIQAPIGIKPRLRAWMEIS